MFEVIEVQYAGNTVTVTLDGTGDRYAAVCATERHLGHLYAGVADAYSRPGGMYVILDRH